MTTNNSIMRRSHERVYCHFRARVHRTLLITTDDCGAFQVENEALTGTLQRMSVQSNQDQMEIQRLSNDLAQGKARVIELQDMVGVLRKDRDALMRSAGDDGSEVREELQKLTNLLTEAEARLVAAKKSLEDDHRTTWELEDKWKNEKSVREACQQRIKQMEVELPARMEQERIYRQNQEQLKLKLEQSRDKFKKDWESAKEKLQEEQKHVQETQAAEEETEGRLKAATLKNQDIQVQVKETEKMLRATEGQRLEVMGRHEALNADLNRLKSQYQVREQLISDLQARIEEDFERWQGAVNTAVQNRKSDDERFLERDKSLAEQLDKLKTEKNDIEEEVRQMVLTMEDRRAELTKKREAFEADLAGQRKTSSQLREDVAKLTQKQQSWESEIERCRNDMQRADASRRAQDQEASLSEARKRHVDAEYEMFLRKEQLRLDFISESQSMHRTAMEELDKAIVDVNAASAQTLHEKEAIDQEIESCNQAIVKFQELEKLRKQRGDEFRDKRYDMLEKFTELLIMQV